jgi:subtilisin-like proprotein convertase family protein
MKASRLIAIVASLVVLTAGAAFADKASELAEKPWRLTDLSALSDIVVFADVNETEPNDTCPGEAYTMGDVFHGELTADDQDWVTFTCNAGDRLTIGTDADGALPTVDTVIELYDDTCSFLTSDDDGGPGLYSLIEFDAPYTGTYNLLVRGFSGASLGNYILIGDCSPPPGAGFCPIGQYKGVKINANVEVSDVLGTIELDPIQFFVAPGAIVTDVVIDLEMDHTWVGDLQIMLEHTSDGGVVTTAMLLDRPGVPESTFGCSGDLVGDPENKYWFGTRPDLFTIGDDVCETVIPQGCYNVAPENAGALEAFRGIDVGDGVWRLYITDNAAGDDGYVYNWSVHLLGEAPVGVEASTWGQVKADYR